MMNDKQRFFNLALLLSLSAATPAYAASEGKLNDTGIQSCGDGTGFVLDCPVTNYQGQDGDYGRDAKAKAGTLVKTGAGNAGFDFTKIANDGSELPATAQLGAGPTDWACTRDNVTGLLWEVKTSDGGVRDKANSFSWYNTDKTSNGGDAGGQNKGTCSGGISCDTQGYTTAVNELKLCGKSDWRMPNITELLGIKDYSRDAPTIDTSYFPDTGPNDWHWSSASYIAKRSEAWAASSYYGGSAHPPKTYGFGLFHVRLVSSGQ